MSSELLRPPINRREFIKAAALLTVVAASAGSTAALLMEKNQIPAALTANLKELDLPSIERGNQIADLLYRLTETQVENASLRTQLRAAEGKLEAAKISLGGSESELTSALQSQLEETNEQNIVLSEEVAVLGGLVALYEQLEAIDLDAVLQDGISNVETAVSDLLLQLPSVQHGLSAGQEALDDLEAQIPALEIGKAWLDDQFDLLNDNLDQLELTLKEALKGAGPLLHQLRDWFQDISRWLPFGIGDKAAGAMNSLSQLLAGDLQSRDEMPSKIGKPLAALLEKEDGLPAIQRKLIKPIRDELMNPTSQAVNHAGSLSAAFETELILPAASAAEERKKLSKLIADYRQLQQI